MSERPTPESALDAGPETLDVQRDPFPGRDGNEDKDQDDQDEAPPQRTPNLGHTLLFFALAVSVFFTCLLAAAFALHGKVRSGGGLDTAVSLGVEGLTYVLTLIAAFYVFPAIWKRSFLGGIHWNGLAARRYLPRLVAAGILLSILAQLGEHLVPEPKTAEIEKLMHTPIGAWSVMLLGTLLAPLMEEIAFRGFLLPSLAIGYDWLSLDRTPAALRRWATTSGSTSNALLFGALFSSFLFAVIHAPQLGYAWGPVSLLFGVSLILSLVRVRAHSVAASTVVHLTYNLTIFLAALLATGGFRHLDRL